MTVFIGMDMVDGTRPTPRPVDLAFIDENWSCRFQKWTFDATGQGLFPGELTTDDFVLAIDGPQGLSGAPKSKMRVCERVWGAAGKTPYDFPTTGPYAGYLTSSVRLYGNLWRTGKYHLFGLPKESSHEVKLLEVYPGGVWRKLGSAEGLPITDKKTTKEGREQRRRLLEHCGVQLPEDSTEVTHDQLDAALAALIAAFLEEGWTRADGVRPFWDQTHEVLREGYIVYPEIS